LKARKDRAPSEDRIREQVRERYGGIAAGNGCCSSAQASAGCCSGGSTSCTAQLGYSSSELEALPQGADLGLGCGNPTAIASLASSEHVLDLGSGAGIDCFLAAKRVGAHGRVIGVDMTPEMVTKARESARKGHYRNVEFRLGEIEHLPAADDSVDVVLSNCVINLTPDKGQVYREAFRVLRPGGRLAISDMVATRPITAKERADPDLWSSCSSGALQIRQVRSLLQRAGFDHIRVEPKGAGNAPESLQGQARMGVVSADIRATKPRGR